MAVAMLQERERLMPIVQDLMASGAGTPPAKQELYDLHAVVEGT